MTDKLDEAERTARASQIVADYVDGASVAELESMYSLTARRIYVILKEAQVELLPKRPKRPLSPLHRHIGMVLREGVFDKGLSTASAANKLGWSYQKITNVMRGTGELTILDLQALSTFLRREYNDLMNPSKDSRNEHVN